MGRLDSLLSVFLDSQFLFCLESMRNTHLSYSPRSTKTYEESLLTTKEDAMWEKMIPGSFTSNQ